MRKIDYLIITTLSTLGQKEYYNQRKKMLEEKDYSCEIFSPNNKDYLKFLLLPYPISLFKTGLFYRKTLNSYLKKVQPKIIEFQNNTVLLQKNNLFQKYKTIISFDYPSKLKLPWSGVLIKFLEMRKIKKADMLIGRSEFALGEINLSNSFFVSHSIKSYIKKQRFGKKNFILYYCSPKCPYEKGLDLAIKFWSIYSKKKGNINLEIVGISKEDSLEYLKKKKIRLPPRITFFGELKKEDYTKKVKNCFFMINTARVEEFGKSILECIAQGKVIFATPTTGAQEILNKNKKLISEDFNPKSLIHLIENSKKEYSINLDKYLYSVNKEKLGRLMKKLLS